MKRILVLLALPIFVVPSSAFAGIKINEIAWMGTDKSQYGEWIELYNDGADAVDLKDAALYEGGGNTLIIKLAKSITAGGYYLIARSTPSMPDPVNGLADDLGSFGGSGLSNSGEYLVLKSATGDILDSLDATSGWPAGDSASKQTMQRSGNNWTTATGTPRAVNSTISASANTDTATSHETSGGSVDGSSVDSGLSGLSAHSDPADLSNRNEEVKVFASAGRNRLAIAGTPVSFEERLFNSKSEEIDGGNVSWSYGDGQTGTGKVAVHVYKFPGDYAVVMNVLRNAESYVARTNVRVVAADLAIVDAGADVVRISNRSDYEANLGGWSLTTDRSAFVIPQDTIVLSKKDISIAIEDTNIDPKFKEISLVSPSKKTISVYLVDRGDPGVQKSDLIANFPLDRLPGQGEQANHVSVLPDQSAVVLLGYEQKLLEAKKQLGLLVPKYYDVERAETVGSLASKQIEAASIVQEEPTTTTVLIVEKPRSIFNTLLSIPMDAFTFMRNLF